MGMRWLIPALAFLALAVAWRAPLLLWLLLAGLAVAGAAFLAYRHLTAACVLWLLLAGATIEMTLTDLIGPEAFQTTIAWVKAVQVGLALLAALRWGGRLDPCNPAWGFAIMAAVGLAHGLYPGLTPLESLRSTIGSIAPFAFCFVRAPRSWAEAMLRAARWCPVVAVAGGAVLAAAGVRPLFIDSGGWRLAGLGHPAFLAGVCLTAIYAGLIQFYRSGGRGELPLLAVNAILLVLTGARAPLFYAAVVVGITLFFVDSPAVAPRRRLVPLLGMAALAPLMLVLALAGDFDAIRLFHVLGGDPGNLSGREYLWAAFEAVTGDSPWVGWGIGAGNVIIPPDGPIAKLLRTWAAHNEYLRLQVEAGHLGRALLIGLFAAWSYRHTRVLPAAERRIMRLVFLALAAHAFTDNVLISTPACVLFAFTAAVFADGRGREGSWGFRAQP